MVKCEWEMCIWNVSTNFTVYDNFRSLLYARLPRALYRLYKHSTVARMYSSRSPQKLLRFWGKVIKYKHGMLR